MITNSVKVDLPRADNTPNEIKPDAVTLSITADGLIHWDKTELSMESMEQRLYLAAEKPVQPEVHIRGDRRCDLRACFKSHGGGAAGGYFKVGFCNRARELIAMLRYFYCAACLPGVCQL